MFEHNMDALGCKYVHISLIIDVTRESISKSLLDTYNV